MKKVVVLIFIIFFAGFAYAQNISELEKQLESMTDPDTKLQLLQQHQSLYVNSNTPIKNQYLLLLGLSLEENNKIDQAFEVFNQSLTSLSPVKKLYRELYINTLLERSYIKYLKTYDVAEYCPDRKQAFEALTPLISADLQVRVYVQYAFCFQTDKEKFSIGLSLLDQALELTTKHKLSPNTHAMVYNASGAIYGKNQMFDKSYEYLLNAYLQWAKVNDYKDMFNMQHSLSITAINMLDFAQAKEHVKEMFILANEQKSFVDFLFFANYNAALLAQAEGNIKQSSAYFIAALKEKNNTQENFFIKQALEQLIINFFRTGEVEQAQYYLSVLRIDYPTYALDSFALKALTKYNNKEYMGTVELLFERIDHEINERRLFIKHATQATALLNSQNIFALDKKLLKKTVEIQELQLSKEQAEKNNVYLLLLFALILFSGLAIFSYYLFKTRQDFIFHAHTDYLTGVYNRRYLFKQSNKIANDALLNDENVFILLLDIDHFKNINDTKGHYAGDMAIKYVVQQCQVYLPSQAYIGRLGGDEFLMVIPNKTKEFAIEIAEKIRKSVMNNELDILQPLPLSVSIGVVNCSKQESLDETIAEADRLLYQAKKSGRNLVAF